MKCVLLSGSPKGKTATSYSLVNYLSRELEKEGVETTIHILSKSIRSESKMQVMLQELDAADYVVLAAPLYIDTLPAHVLEVMKRIDIHRRELNRKHTKFIGIMNSGFPESEHNELALDILHAFCDRVNLHWAGGLPFGGGGIIGGIPLDEVGGRGRNAMIAMSKLALSIASDEDASFDTIEQIKKQVIPKRLYIMFAQRGWKQMARNSGVEKTLDAKPYCS